MKRAFDVTEENMDRLMERAAMGGDDMKKTILARLAELAQGAANAEALEAIQRGDLAAAADARELALVARELERHSPALLAAIGVVIADAKCLGPLVSVLGAGYSSDDGVGADEDGNFCTSSGLTP
jgi:hypothetical protein